MLSNYTSTKTFNASSRIEVGDEEKDVMFMYGNINAEGKPSWTSNIADVTLYKENKKTVDADFAEFQQRILDEV